MKASIRYSLVALALATSAACGSSGEDSAESAGALTIGVIAPLAGPGAFPEVEVGLKAAVHHINEVLGGVGGKTLELDICRSNGTPEFVISCANSFVSDDVAVVYDAIVLQSDAAGPVLQSAGIPVVGTAPGGTVLSAQPYGSAFFLAGGAGSNVAANVALFEKLDAGSVAVAVPASPQAQAYINKILVPAGRKVGTEVVAQFVDPGAINVQVLASRLMSSKPDAILTTAFPEDSCGPLFSALRAKKFDGDIIAGVCSKFIDEIGDDAEGAILIGRNWGMRARDAAPPEVQEQLDSFKEALEATGGAKSVNDGRATSAYAGLVSLANVLNSADGPITADAVSAAMKGLDAAPTTLLADATCDGKQWPGSPGECSREVLYLVVQKDGTVKPLDGDGFVDVPATS